MPYALVSVASLIAILAFVSPVALGQAPGKPLQTMKPAGTALSAEDRKKFDQVMELVNTYSGLGDNLERAHALISDIRQRNPNSALALVGWAEVRVRTDGTIPEALETVRQALSLDPNAAEAYVMLTRMLVDQGQMIDAQAAAAKALQLAPGRPEVMFVQALVAKYNKQYDVAESWYSKALEAQPNTERKSNIYFAIGEMLLEKEPPDIPRGIASLKQAMELSRNSPWKLNNISGLLVHNTGDYNLAADAAIRALKIMDFGAAKTNLGFAAYGQWARAYQNAKGNSAQMRNIDPPREIARWSGVTPDYMFVYSSRTRAGESIATALLQSKAVTNVDVVPPGEQGTALVSAAMGNHAQLAAKLISAGANVNAEHTSDKRTPLVIFTMNRNLQAVQLLTAKGARVNHVDGYGHPLLQYAMEAEASARDPAIPITRHLLKVGANPSIPNRYGLDFTMAATRQLSLPAVKLMIEEYKANPNLHTPPPNNISLLTTAAITSAVGVDSSSLVQYLLNKGASPWVQWNGSDILRTLENNPDPSTFTYYAKNAALIKDARKRSSKPAGFQEYIQGPPQQR